MRIFNNESMWDAENQCWYETYTIDGQVVDEETYMEQFKVEELVADEMELEESYDNQYDVSPECANCDGCDEHCGRGNHDEEYIDEVDDNICSECGETDCVCDYEECMCDDCRSQRHDDIVNASVGKAFEKIMESDGCEGCIVEALYEMSLEMKRLGWSDHKDYIDQCNC